MNPIEELLKKEKNTLPTLSDNAKDRLFARVLEKEEAMHMPSWQERMRTWFVIPVLSFGALGIAVFVFWFTTLRVQDAPEQQQIAQTNQNTSQNSNVLQENTNTAQVESVVAHARSIDEYVFGSGGAAPSHHWTITTALNFEQLSGDTVSTGMLPVLSSGEVSEIASLLGVDMSALHMRKTELGDAIYTTQPASAQSTLCLEARVLRGISGRCVFISTRGVIDIEQNENEASGEGLTEAFSYITKLSSLSQDEWIVTPLGATSHSTEIAKWKQYYITPRSSKEFLGQAWHVSLSNGELVSLLGSVVNPQSDTIASDVISPTEAFARVQEDFDQATTASGVSEERWVVGFYTDPFGDEILSARESVDIDVQSVTLTTALFETPVSSGHGSIVTYPVYQVSGIERGTENAFDVVVDASVLGVLNAKHYRMITHPAQLLGM